MDYLLQGEDLECDFPEKGLGERYFNLFLTMKDSVVQVDSENGEIDKVSSLKIRSVQIATYLQSLLVRSGDRVVLCGKGRLDDAAIVFGTLFIGAELANLTPDLPFEDFEKILNILQPKVVFCDPRISTFIYRFKVPVTCEINIFKKDDASCCAQKIFNNKFDQSFKPVAVEQESIAFIVLTEGSISSPKLVAISHKAAFLRIKIVLEKILKGCKKVVAYFSLLGSSQLIITCASLEQNFCRIIPAVFAEREVCRIISGLNIDTAILGTAYALTLARFISECEDYDISCLQHILVGGAPTSAKTMAQVNSSFTGSVLNIYGVTECGPIAGISLEDLYLETVKPATCGKVFPGGTVKIVDFKTGRSLGTDKWGELCYASPCLASGYLVKHNKMKPLEKDFFKTGDVAQYDDQSCIYIHGCLEDIFFKDEKFFSAVDIIEVLMTHPDILDACVSNKNGLIVVFVVVSDIEIPVQDIREWLDERLPPHMKPDRLEIVGEIYKTKSGKVKRYLENKMKVCQSFIRGTED